MVLIIHANRQIDIDVRVYTHIYTFWLCLLKQPRSSHTPQAISTPSAQIDLVQAFGERLRCECVNR